MIDKVYGYLLVHNLADKFQLDYVSNEKLLLDDIKAKIGNNPSYSLYTFEVSIEFFKNIVEYIKKQTGDGANNMYSIYHYQKTFGYLQDMGVNLVYNPSNPDSMEWTPTVCVQV